MLGYFLIIAGPPIIMFIMPFVLTIIVYRFIRKKYKKQIALIFAPILPLVCTYGFYLIIRNGFFFDLGVRITVIMAILAAITYLIYRLVSLKFQKYIAMVCASVLPLSLYFIFIYPAVFPGDDFYKMDFKKVVGLEFPESGDILRKDASWPDHFGDYSSCALIKFSEEDYQMLLKHIKNHRLFEGSNFQVDSRQLYKVLRKKDVNKLDYIASYEERCEIRFVGFLDDGKTVIFQWCSW